VRLWVYVRKTGADHERRLGVRPGVVRAYDADAGTVVVESPSNLWSLSPGASAYYGVLPEDRDLNFYVVSKNNAEEAFKGNFSCGSACKRGRVPLWRTFE
jgi:hypothetical protein